MSDTAKELAACVRFAAAVSKAMPVDHEADRLAAAAMRRHYESLPPPRKIKRKP
jgi:hypothetical protein